MPLIGRRYAEALVDIAAEKGSIDTFRKELSFIAEEYGNQPEFKSFLLNPEIKGELRKLTLTRIFEGKVSIELLNVLLLLADKGRLEFLPAISDEFAIMADKKKNILNMTIISASPLEAEQIEKIKKKYSDRYRTSSVRAAAKIDPSAIGGVKVVIGDKVEDATIKGQLESIKALLLSRG